MSDNLMPAHTTAELRAEVARRSARLRRRRRAAIAGPALAFAVVMGLLGLPSVHQSASDRIEFTDGHHSNDPTPGAPASEAPVAAGGSVPATTPDKAAARTPTTTVRASGAPLPVPPTTPPARMAFVRGGEVFEQRTDGTGLHRLFPGAASSPAWAPDGKRVAVVETDRAGSRRVAIVTTATGERRVLKEAADASFSDPAWSPEGRWVAVTKRARVGDGQSVWRLDAATGDASEVAASGSRPAWSPDGRLVFECAEGLCIANGGTGGAGGVVPNSAGLYDPAWSPDGRRLAVLDRSLRLVLLHPDGTGRRVVAEKVVAGAAWFPGSDRLAYAADPSGTLRGIWSIGVDGADRRQLTNQVGDDAPALTN